MKRIRTLRRWRHSLALGLFAATAANAQPAVILNDYGHVGLMQTPTARSLGKGHIGFSYSDTDPLEVFSLYVQPLDWLQGNYRFVNITNPDKATSPGRSTFTDKSADFQIRLWRENDYLPQVAVGVIDVGGTGLFSSEYVVASRRVYNWDFHLGVGWGRLGKRADISSPLGQVFSRYEDRRTERSQGGGRPNIGNWFTGDAALFGGAVWSPGGGPFSLMVELEGNNYRDEKFGVDPDVDSRVNVGVNYRLAEAVDITASWQRADTFGISVDMHGDFERMRGPEKVLRPRPSHVPAWRTFRQQPFSRALDDAGVQRLQRDLRRQWINVHAVDTEEGDNGREVTVWMSQAMGRSLPLVGGRVARSLIQHTGDHYEVFHIVEVVSGNESARFSLPREPYMRAVGGDWTADELSRYVESGQPQPEGYRKAEYRNLLRYPVFDYNFSPFLRSNIGGPEKFALTQLMARVSGSMQLTSRLNVVGSMAVNVADNFGDRLDQDFPEELPQVRSNIRRYLREGKDAYLAQLEANYLFPIATDVHGRVSAGIFEEMFGGVATEVLYRPTGARWAIGLEAAYVRQRDFKQRFDFIDYETGTGHLTYYHELPWQNVRVKASVGRYLARDVGATLDISRQFGSGARFGVFATMTNVSSSTFGEGSFDKGFYLSLPFSLFNAQGGRGAAEFQFRPLARDGGQKVYSGRKLYDALEHSHTRSLQRRSEEWLQ